MRVLFVHQNFPGQFKHLAPALAQLGHEVVAMLVSNTEELVWNGVRLAPYQLERRSTPGVHRWVLDVESKVVRAEACFQAALKLRSEGFSPDVIVAHPGWGESMFLKEVWPKARLGIYCEFFYHATGADTGFDPEFLVDEPGKTCRLRMKNVNNLIHFEIAEAGLSPTHWQASTFPEQFRSRISVIHDGIDTQLLTPNPQVSLSLKTGAGQVIALTRHSEVITFVNRNLEPYRGYHIFMRALPELLRRRPNARVLIVGGDDVSYGPASADGRKWKHVFAQEVRPQISDADWSRVHFLGKVPYPQFVSLLQLSTVHVYLTYPFVLSWSLLEAMSVGCAIVASNTKPVLEAIEDDVTGVLVDFFDHVALTDQLVELLDDPSRRQRLGTAAREFAQTCYDLKRICLPQQLQWVDSFIS